MTVEWRIIPDFPNYEVSSDGQVRHANLKIIKSINVHHGYYRVMLYKNKPKRKIKIMVHNLVTQTFLGKKPEGLHVNHKDGNKLNNNILNLEYVTTQENTKHAWDNNLHSGYCENHHNAKLTNNDVMEIRQLLSQNLSKKYIAIQYNVTSETISNIQKGKTWKRLLSLKS